MRQIRLELEITFKILHNKQRQIDKPKRNAKEKNAFGPVHTYPNIFEN